MRDFTTERNPEDYPLDEQWKVDAACQGMDPEIFFPGNGRPGMTPEASSQARSARQVCLSCPVQAQCLEWALTNHVAFGIWGGLGERSRKIARRERRSA